MLRKRLMLLNAAIVVVGFLAAFFCAAVQIQSQYRQEFESRLNTALAILSTEDREIRADPHSAAEEVGKRLSASGQEMRISIIDPSGRVTGDSEKDEIDQNHLQRPEIQAALKTGSGTDTRVSATTGRRYFYKAVYLPGKYFIRAALPTGELDAAVGRLWLTAAFSMLLGILIACGLTSWLVYRVMAPLGRLTAAATQISQGDYSCRAEGDFRDEVGVLADSFNHMAQSTENAVFQLTEQQNRLNGVLQGMDDGVLAAGQDGRILFLNQSARRLLQKMDFTEGDPLSGNLLVNQLADLMKTTVGSGVPVTRILTAGAEKQYSVYAAPIPGQKTAAALAVITDVTRLRNLEKMRSEFVSNVTHELKTPLTSIRGSIDLLKSADRDEKTRRYFYDVLDIEAERLQHLIDDMLVLSRIENAKDDPSARPCSVAEAVRNCADRIGAVAEKNQVSIILHLDESVYVSCSPTRLEQLFGNLIENAVKYNVPNGSVTVTSLRQKGTALIRVQDTGIGIAKEHFERLFERFYRVDTSRSRAVGGTGLGLSIVKHLVVLYGGDIEVDSEIGKGSTFTVRLPLVSPP